MFGSCKSISGKYSIFQKCYFLERKMFSCVWLHFKKFSEKYFMVFGKEEGKDKPRKTRTKPKKKIINDRLGSTARCFASSSPTTAPLIAISRSTAPLRKIAIDASRECDRREGKILTGCNSTNLSCIFDLKLIILTRYTSSLAIRVLSISPTFSFSF